MIAAYEEKFSKMKVKRQQTPAITNDYWVRQLKVLNAAMSRKNKNFVPFEAKDFTREDIWLRDNSVSTFMPSDLLHEGEYPLCDFQSNAFVYSLFGKFKFFDSNDYKFIN